MTAVNNGFFHMRLEDPASGPKGAVMTAYSTQAYASNTLANPTVITCTTAPGSSGVQAQVTIAASTSVPSLNGTFTATYLSPTTFSVPVDCTVAHTPSAATGTGTVTKGGPVFYTISASAKASTASWDIPVTEVTYNTNPVLIETADEIRGLTGSPYHSGAGDYDVQITAKARVRPKMLGLLLYMITGNTVTDVVGNGALTEAAIAGYPTFVPQTLATGTYQHKYSWNTSTFTPPTATIYFAPPNGDGWQASGCALSSLAFSYETSNTMIVDMTFMGLYLQNNDLLQVTPDFYEGSTNLALPLIKKGDCEFVGDGVFSPSPSRATDFTLTVEQTMFAFQSFGNNATWRDTIEYDAASWQKVTGTIVKREMKAQDLFRVIGPGPTNCWHEAMVAQSDGTLVQGGAALADKFAFYVDMQTVQYVSVNPDNISNIRRIGVNLNWEARIDSAKAAWCDFYVTNTQPVTDYTTMASS